MGIGDLFGQAKEQLAGHEEQVDGAIDRAAEAAKDKAPDNVDGAIDSAADKAKDVL